MRRKKTQRQRENEALDAIIALAFLPTLIFEHDTVCVRSDTVADGYSIRAGTVGTVVSVYGGGRAFAVEFPGLEPGPAVVTLSRELVELRDGQ